MSSCTLQESNQKTSSAEHAKYEWVLHGMITSTVPLKVVTRGISWTFAFTSVTMSSLKWLDPTVRASKSMVASVPFPVTSVLVPNLVLASFISPLVLSMEITGNVPWDGGVNPCFKKPPSAAKVAFIILGSYENRMS
jgi:hypothetical protein